MTSRFANRPSALALLLLVSVIGAGATAAPNTPENNTVYVVTYQCAGEAPQSFQFAGTRRVPPPYEVKQEAKWYWARSRADRGEGCRILTVDGLPFRD
jgi:hypothetical protein